MIFLLKTSLLPVTSTRNIHSQIRQRHALNRLVVLGRKSGKMESVKDDRTPHCKGESFDLIDYQTALSGNCLTGSSYYLGNVLICTSLNSCA